jgi:hypothetical protein
MWTKRGPFGLQYFPCGPNETRLALVFFLDHLPGIFSRHLFTTLADLEAMRQKMNEMILNGRR